MEMILRAKADPNSCSSEKGKPSLSLLLMALRSLDNQEESTLKLLLKAKADPDMAAGEDRTYPHDVPTIHSPYLHPHPRPKAIRATQTHNPRLYNSQPTATQPKTAQPKPAQATPPQSAPTQPCLILCVRASSLDSAPHAVAWRAVTVVYQSCLLLRVSTLLGLSSIESGPALRFRFYFV